MGYCLFDGLKILSKQNAFFSRLLIFNFNPVFLKNIGFSAPHSSFLIFLYILNVEISLSNQTIILSNCDVSHEYWHIWTYSSHLILSFLFSMIYSFFSVSFHVFHWISFFQIILYWLLITYILSVHCLLEIICSVILKTF